MKLTPAEIDRALEMVVEENRTQKKLREALRWLGPNGEAWGKGDGSCNVNTVPSGSYCVMMAVSAVTTPFFSSEFGAVANALDDAAAERDYITSYKLNDDPKITFADIRALFHRAIELAA